MQVVLEMVELRETDTARALLRQTNVFQRMRQDDPDRLLRLERLCNQTYFDIRSAVLADLVLLLDSSLKRRLCYNWSAANA